MLVLAGCATAAKAVPQGETCAVPSTYAARSIEVLRASLHAPAEAGDGSPPRRRDIHEICAQNAEEGIAWCAKIAAGDPNDCIEMCMAEYRSSHPPPHAEARRASGAPVPLPPRPIAAPGPEAPSAFRPLDPYFFALADCIRRAREGDARSVCRFSSPLDQMDFGQKHCDERCAELAAMSSTAAPTR
jgi:hypothetical protein